jgi:hypothetical protein
MTSQKATVEATSLRQTMKVAADTAHATQHELSTALDAATIRIVALEATNKEAALDREASAKKFWTGDQSVRVLMSPTVPANSNFSCIQPKTDGSAKVRLRFVVINMSPYEVKIVGVRFNFTATMDAFQVSGEYNGPPGEQEDSVIKLPPWKEQHFFLRVKGTLANPRRYTGGPGTRIAYLFLHDNCYVTVRGHWDGTARAPLTGTTDYILVSWEEFR